MMTANSLLRAAPIRSFHRCLVSSSSGSQTSGKIAWTSLVNGNGNQTRAQPFTTRIKSSNTLAARQSSQQRNILAWATMYFLAGLATTSFINSSSNPIRNDDDEAVKSSDKKNGKDTPLYTKDELSVICIIGGPAAGKSTQVDNVAKRFDLIKVDGQCLHLG